jgi:hypothetical protein
MFLAANAVRYGTAKGEWFLNAVSRPHPNYLKVIFKHCISTTDGSSAIGRGDQDSQAVAKVISGVRYHEIVHWRRRYPWNYNRRYSHFLMPVFVRDL